MKNKKIKFHILDHNGTYMRYRYWYRYRDDTFHYECARLQLVRAHLCTNPNENLVGGQLLSYEPKFQIS